jgi:hypothetical protein
MTTILIYFILFQLLFYLPRPFNATCKAPIDRLSEASSCSAESLSSASCSLAYPLSRAAKRRPKTTYDIVKCARGPFERLANCFAETARDAG